MPTADVSKCIEPFDFAAGVGLPQNEPNVNGQKTGLFLREESSASSKNNASVSVSVSLSLSLSLSEKQKAQACDEIGGKAKGESVMTVLQRCENVVNTSLNLSQKPKTPYDQKENQAVVHRYESVQTPKNDEIDAGMYVCVCLSVCLSVCL